jgi:hypothetical protein
MKLMMKLIKTMAGMDLPVIEDSKDKESITRQMSLNKKS